MYKLNCKYICGSVKTGLIDYDHFDEMSTFETCYIVCTQTKLNLLSGRATCRNG